MFDAIPYRSKLARHRPPPKTQNSYNFPTFEHPKIAPNPPKFTKIAFFTIPPKSRLPPKSPIFFLQQSGNQAELKINTTGKKQEEIDTEYKVFWGKIAAKNPGGGAVSLLQRRIAERLPLAYDRVLQYYLLILEYFFLYCHSEVYLLL